VAIASKTHDLVKSHTLIVVYLAVIAAVVIPLASHVFNYWKPVVESWAPATQAKKVGRI
jgi:hypothetical protein